MRECDQADTGEPAPPQAGFYDPRRAAPMTPTSPPPQAHSRLTAVEVFCGVGGMALGFERAGFDVLAAADVDPLHLAVHERNFPQARALCSDVRWLSGDRLLAAAVEGWERRYPATPFPGSVDCLFGGPSCQGFSVIGPRKADDRRNLLVGEFARLVVELQPRWFVMENVPGLISPKHRPTLQSLYATLRVAGFHVAAPWILNARDHGVPQERRRVFVVGCRENGGLPAPPRHAPDRVTVRDALADLPPLRRFKSLLSCDHLDLSDRWLAFMRARQTPYVHRINGTDGDPQDLSDDRAWDCRRLSSVGLVLHNADVVARFRRLRGGERDVIGRLPRLDYDAQSPTLRAGTGRDHGSFTSARPVHPREPRVITVREAARLHGLPDWFGLHTTKWHGFRQVGNAVPPPLAEAVARAVLNAGHVTPNRRPAQPLELGDQALLSLRLYEAADRYGLDRRELPANVRRHTTLPAGAA